LGPLAGGYVFDTIGKEYIFYLGASMFFIAALTASYYIKLEVKTNE